MVSKPSESFRLVFETDGFPRELLTIPECKMAIISGDLRPETDVIVYRPGQSPRATRAEEIGELSVVFKVSTVPPALPTVPVAECSSASSEDGFNHDNAINTPTVQLSKHEAKSGDLGAPEDGSVPQGQAFEFVAQGYSSPRWPKLVFAVLTVIALTSAWFWLGSLSEKKSSPAFVTYTVRTATNLRSAPTVDSTIEGKLEPGEKVTGVLVTRTEPPEWMEITEGLHAGRFVWLNNLAASAANAELVSASAPPAKLASLERIIVFADPVKCEYAEPLKSIVQNLWKYDEKASKIVGVANVQVPGFGLLHPVFRRNERNDGGVEFSSYITLRGEWHGLRVSRILSEGVEESDVGSTQIRFLETPAKVRSVLNNQGFMLAPVGDHRELNPDSALPGAIWVDAIPGGAALGCN